jgi:cytochrome c biogenesis protein CcmG/thiol:disulfide interchange protein DsbE
MKKYFTIAGICCALPLIVIALLAWRGNQQGLSTTNLSAIEVGKPAPDFNVQTIDGQQFSLADHKGKAVVIFAMFGGCGECIPVGQTLNQIQKDYAARGVSVIAIDILKNEPTSTLEQYRDFVQAKFLFVSYNENVVQAYRLTAPEITYVIDKNGNIAYINQKGLSYEQYKQQIEKSL